MAKFKDRTDQLRLLGHVAQADDDQLERIIFESIPEDLRFHAPITPPKPRERFFAPSIAANPYGPEDGE